MATYRILKSHPVHSPSVFLDLSLCQRHGAAPSAQAAGGGGWMQRTPRWPALSTNILKVNFTTPLIGGKPVSWPPRGLRKACARSPAQRCPARACARPRALERSRGRSRRSQQRKLESKMPIWRVYSSFLAGGLRLRPSTRLRRLRAPAPAPAPAPARSGSLSRSRSRGWIHPESRGGS